MMDCLWVIFSHPISHHIMIISMQAPRIQEKSKKQFSIQSVQTLLICLIEILILEQQCFHTSWQHQQQSRDEPVQAVSVQNCMQGFQSTALVCYWGNCLIWPSFMSQIGTAGCISRKTGLRHEDSLLGKNPESQTVLLWKGVSRKQQATPGSQSQSVWSGRQS